MLICTYRVEDVLKEKYEEKLEELQERYKRKLDRLESQLDNAYRKLEKEKADQTSSIISAGISIVSALFGSKSMTSLSTAASRSGRVMKERGDISRAQAKVEELEERISELQAELEEKIEELHSDYSLETYEIDTIFIKPKKSLIDINEVALLWRVAF
jgi:uncharacterized protein YbcI